MIILSIESSCDETAAAVTRDGREILSDEILSQADLHKIYGGVVPEIASRRHIEAIDGLANLAIEKAGVNRSELDAIAVTNAPGLIGALLVGVNFAKSAAYALNVPLIPVHHIRGHIAACYLAYPELEPPFTALVVSGGHSLIIDVQCYTEFQITGTTRDDAAGECFDKCARVLGLPYPGGKAIDELAQSGDETRYPLPRPKIASNPFDMSFSGLKTAIVNLCENIRKKDEALDMPSLAASFCKAVSDALVSRAIKAVMQHGYGKLCLCGGVAANSVIRRDLQKEAKIHGISLFPAPLALCQDNAAMIGAQAYYEFLAGNTAGCDLNAYATMPVSKTGKSR